MPDTILKRWNGSTFEELYPKTTVTQLSASGTPSSTTFLRGDGQWVTPAGTGTVTSVSSGTQISGMAMTITNGTTTPSIATSVSNAASFRTSIGAGDVVGPASSVTARIATFNGTTGKIIQDSGTLISGLATSTHVHGNITNAGAIGATAHRLPITGTSGVLTTLASSGLTQQVLLSNGSTVAPAFGYLGSMINSDSIVSATANTWTTAFEMSLPEGQWQINFNGAWSRTNTSSANTFSFSAVFNQASFAAIVGSGFYGITNSATSFTNYALDHSSATDGVASSGFTTTSATTSVTNGRIQFSAYVTSVGTNILRIRIRSSVGSACRLKAGSGFTAIRVG
jgi:hypothetical protein